MYLLFQGSPSHWSWVGAAGIYGSPYGLCLVSGSCTLPAPMYEEGTEECHITYFANAKPDIPTLSSHPSS